MAKALITSHFGGSSKWFNHTRETILRDEFGDYINLTPKFIEMIPDVNSMHFEFASKSYVTPMEKQDMVCVVPRITPYPNSEFARLSKMAQQVDPQFIQPYNTSITIGKVIIANKSDNKETAELYGNLPIVEYPFHFLWFLLEQHRTWSDRYYATRIKGAANAFREQSANNVQWFQVPDNEIIFGEIDQVEEQTEELKVDEMYLPLSTMEDDQTNLNDEMDTTPIPGTDCSPPPKARQPWFNNLNSYDNHLAEIQNPEEQRGPITGSPQFTEEEMVYDKSPNLSPNLKSPSLPTTTFIPPTNAFRSPTQPKLPQSPLLQDNTDDHHINRDNETTKWTKNVGFILSKFWSIKISRKS